MNTTMSTLIYPLLGYYIGVIVYMRARTPVMVCDCVSKGEDCSDFGCVCVFACVSVCPSVCLCLYVAMCTGC